MSNINKSKETFRNKNLKEFTKELGWEFVRYEENRKDECIMIIKLDDNYIKLASSYEYFDIIVCNELISITQQEIHERLLTKNEIQKLVVQFQEQCQCKRSEYLKTCELLQKLFTNKIRNKNGSTHDYNYIQKRDYTWLQLVDFVVDEDNYCQKIKDTKYHRYLCLQKNIIVEYNICNHTFECYNYKDDNINYCLYDDETDMLYSYEEDKKWKKVSDRRKIDDYHHSILDVFR